MENLAETASQSIYQLRKTKPIKMSGHTNIPDSHLHSAIRADFRKSFICQNSKKIPPFLKSQVESCPVPIKDLDIDSEKIYGVLLSGVYSNTTILHWTTENFRTTLGLIQEHVENWLQALGLEHVRSETRYQATDEDLKIYSEKIKWEDLRISMQKAKSTGQLWKTSRILPAGVTQLQFSSHFMIVTTKSKEKYLLDYDQVMMISDTISSRALVLLYHSMLPDHIPGRIDRMILIKIFSTFDHYFWTCGNEAYSTIKYWEAIVIGILIKHFDRIPDSASFLSSIEKEIEKEELMVAKMMMEVLEKERFSEDQLSELHGFYRFWGHPTVDEEAGCLKVKKIAQSRPAPNEVTLREMDGLFNRQFCISFIKKHGRWPCLNPKHLPKGAKLKKAIIHHTTSLDLFSPAYPLNDWASLELEKEFDFDYMDDFTEIVDDKSISIKRSELRTLYSKASLGYDPGSKSTSRRLLLEILSMKEIDIKTIVDKLCRREWDINDLIVIVHSKERELKICPRLFAMMTLAMRIFFVITEKNIKNQIFSYFPQQTMTLSEATLNHRLFNLTSLDESTDLGYFVAFAHIDFKSWNLHWSLPALIYLCRRLNQLFGIPGLFETGHLFFFKCLIALASHHNPPVSLIADFLSMFPEECATLWYKHGGGFEGILQKLWTLQTIILLLLVEFYTGIKSIITGQGDNQIVKMLIPLLERGLTKDQYILKYWAEIKEAIATFLECLRQKAGDIGLEVKVDESFVTTDTLVYGKKIIYKGAFLSQGSKRIARLLTDINEVYPTIFNKVSTLQTAGLSTAQHSHTILTPYILCQMETLFTIQRDCSWSILLKSAHHKDIIKWVSKPETLRFLLLYASILGGPPILPLNSFMYRGHPDPLTAALTDIYLISSNSKIAERFYIYWQNLRCTPGKSSGEFLLLSPFALNLDLPNPSISIFKSFLSKRLPDLTQNVYLSDIFSQDIHKEEEELMKKLLEVHPLYPTVCHEVLSCTVVGAMNAFLARFATTRTTQLMGTDEDTSRNIYSRVQKSEEEFFKHWKEVHDSIATKEIKKECIVSCPFVAAKSLRAHTWNRALKGRAIHGVTVPHPFHQFRFSFCDGERHSACIGFPERVSYLLTSNDSQVLLRQRGPFNPYLGSRTKEKKTGRVIVLPISSRPLESAERLCVLGSWCTFPGSNMENFLQTLSATRTNVPFPILKLAAGSISSGALQHRLNDHISKRTAQNNSLPNITTHIYLSTDTLGRFSKGEDNYNMHVQGVILAGFSLLQVLCTNSLTLPGLHASMHFNCRFDLEPLEEALVDIDDPDISVSIKAHNPLIYTNLIEASQLASSSFTDSILVSDVSDDYAGATIMLGRIISALNISSWGVTEYHTLSSSIIGVQEILRIGLSRLIKALGVYIVLLFSYDKDKILKIVNMLPLNIWADIAPICLMPEVLPQLSELSNLHLSDAYVNPNQVSRMLSRALCICIESFYKKVDRDPRFLKHITFYLSDNVGIRRVWFMWAKLMNILSEGKYDISSIVSESIVSCTGLSNLPSPAEIGSLTTKILAKYGYEGLNFLWHENRIRLSRYPPEERMRLRERPDPLSIRVKKLSKAPHAFDCKIMNLGYPIKIDMSLPCDVWESFRALYDSRLVQFPDYCWYDHFYHLFGHTSSSFFKVLEILIIESIKEVKTAIALGDGEGGIARLLYEYYDCKILFNSLIDQKLLIPHRAYGYTPASFFDIPSKVDGAYLSAIYGGNLLDTSFLEELLQLSEKTDLVSCDAELINSSPKEWMQLLANVLHICAKVRSKTLIFKTYYRDSRMTCDMLGMCNVLYKYVSVVVTTFSSNETYEYHLVCKELVDGITPYHNLSSVQGQHFRVASYSSPYSTIEPMFKSRIQSEPFQISRNLHVVSLYDLAEKLKIPSNLHHSLERYTLNIMLYQKHQTIRDYLLTVKENSYRLCLDELRGFGLSQEGTTVSPYLKAVMSRTRSVHSALERYFIIMINCVTLLMLMHDSNLGEVYKALKKHINQEHCLTGPDGNKLYSLEVNWKEWREEFLKLFWVILGHSFITEQNS